MFGLHVCADCGSYALVMGNGHFTDDAAVDWAGQSNFRVWLDRRGAVYFGFLLQV